MNKNIKKKTSLISRKKQYNLLESKIMKMVKDKKKDQIKNDFDIEKIKKTIEIVNQFF